MTSKIIRFLNQDKAEYFFQDRGIFFSPAGKQSDTQEGIFNTKAFPEVLNMHLENRKQPRMENDLTQRLENFEINKQKNLRANSFLSCWYYGEEDKEMWETYGNNGIAIVSTDYLLSYGAAPRELIPAIEKGPVRYSDNEKEQNFTDPLLSKNEIYANEKEYRIIFNLTKHKIFTGFEGYDYLRLGNFLYHESPEITVSHHKERLDNHDKIIHKKEVISSDPFHGYVLKYNLNALVEEIILHPEADEEYKKHIEECCRSVEINPSKVRFSELKF